MIALPAICPICRRSIIIAYAKPARVQVLWMEETDVRQLWIPHEHQPRENDG